MPLSPDLMVRGAGKANFSDYAYQIGQALTSNLTERLANAPTISTAEAALDARNSEGDKAFRDWQAAAAAYHEAYRNAHRLPAAEVDALRLAKEDAERTMRAREKAAEAALNTVHAAQWENPDDVRANAAEAALAADAEVLAALDVIREGLKAREVALKVAGGPAVVADANSVRPGRGHWRNRPYNALGFDTATLRDLEDLVRQYPREVLKAQAKAEVSA